MKNRIVGNLGSKNVITRYQHWVLDSIREEPESLAQCWEEHKRMFRLKISQLERTAVMEITAWLQKGGLAKEVAELIAEDMPCRYLDYLEEHRRNPRNSQRKEEVEAIRKAAEGLHRALNEASGYSLGSLQMDIFLLWSVGEGKDDIAARGMKWLLDTEEGKEVMRARNFVIGGTAKGNDELDDVRPSPEFMYALLELKRAATMHGSLIPEDKGGPVSGASDPTGARARTYLTDTVRALLRDLGLPYGVHKGGPVSKLLSLIHRAATGEEAAWADRYAAMAPTLEKKRATGSQG